MLKLITSCCGNDIEDCPGCSQNMQLVDIYTYIMNNIGIDWEIVDFSKDEFLKGMKAEYKEHKEDPETKVINTLEQAGKIAWSHLKEDPKYYEKLAKLEESNNTYLNSVLSKIDKQLVTIDDFNILLAEATPPSVIDRVRRKMNPSHDRNKKRKMKDIKIAARVQPSRKRSNNTQMQHGGKQGHRHSVRKQKRQNRFHEAAGFINKNIGKSISEEDITVDKNALFMIANKLMSHENANREWLYDLLGKIKNVRHR